MDDPDSALPVTGANEDMNRLATMIRRGAGKISSIDLTCDSHHTIDIAHAGTYRDQAGKPARPFTLLTPDDYRAGIWRHVNHSRQYGMLGGKTAGDYIQWYLEELERRGRYLHMLWPEHCLMGTPGHAVQTNLMNSLNYWTQSTGGWINFVTKGVNPFCEHFGVVEAEVPVASDPTTGLNSRFLQALKQSDIVLVAGQALSHCVRASVDQIADNIGDDQISKFHILTDCSSSVGAVPGGPDFPAMTQEWLKTMEARGMKLTTSDTFFS